MDSKNIWLDCIDNLRFNNNINQKEIDDYFYHKWEEIKFLFTPDQWKISTNFSTNLKSLEARLSKCWLAYNLDVVIKNSEIETSISYKNHKKDSKYIKKHTLFKEISYIEWKIYSMVNDEIFKLTQENIKEENERVDNDYIFKTQIKEKEKEIEWLQEPLNEINNYLGHYLNKTLEWLQSDNYKNFKDNFNKIKDVFKNLWYKYASLKILDPDWLQQSILKIENRKVIEYKDIKTELVNICDYITEVIRHKKELFDKDLKEIKKSYENYKENRNKTYKWIYLKSNSWNENNKDIFNKLSLFVKKYLNDFYIVKENSIKLIDNKKTELSNFNITDNLDE